MRIKIFLLAVVCSFGVMDSYAQKGVDTGTPYGSGADSVRCVENISLFIPYAKANNFKDAYEFWKIVYEECPIATKDIYLYGVRIVAWQIENEKDAAKRDALIDDLMGVYDKRVKYFGDDQRYGKDWIVGRKASDYIKYKTDKADAKLLYGWLKEVVDQYGNNTDALAISLYMFASYQMMAANEDLKPTYIADYLKSVEMLDKQIDAATAANNEKELNALTSYKQVVEGTFINSGAADCETLQNIYGPKVEQSKDDLQFLQETIALLRRMRCNEIEAYFVAAEYAHKVQPTSESARGLARQAVRKNDYATAITFFEEAASLETDNVVKGEDYYMIAILYSDQNQYARTKQYALKAVEANPNYGQPLLLIGKLYAASANSIFPNDNVMKKTVYYAAVDKFERARAVDPSVASEANTLINTYRAYFPSTEEVFMHPDLTKGETITIPGWINERTTIR